MKRALLLAIALVASCRPAPVVEVKPVATVSAPTVVAEAPAPPPAIADAGPTATADAEGPASIASSLETWHLGDFDVVASLPSSGLEKRPIVVGIHGSHDRPEDTCRRWRLAFADWPFIVCPAGVPYKGGLAWGAPSVIAERIDRAIAALRERHASQIAAGPVVYAGWSLGGTRGPGVVATKPGFFEPVILAEVGHTKLDANGSLASIRKGKASHVIIACATKRCVTFDQRLVRARGKERAPSIELVDGGIGRGHLFDKLMAQAIGATLVKSVAGDERWAGFAVARETAIAKGSIDESSVTAPEPEQDDEPDLAP